MIITRIIQLLCKASAGNICTISGQWNWQLKLYKSKLAIRITMYSFRRELASPPKSLLKNPDKCNSLISAKLQLRSRIVGQTKVKVKGNVLQIHSKVKGIFFHLCASFRKCGSRKAVSFFRLEGPGLDALVMVLSTMIGLILHRIYIFSN